MKRRRSARLVDMTRHLLQHPNTLVPLSFFCEQYESAKSSISEDLHIIKESLETGGYGTVRTTAGAQGGVTYVPAAGQEEARAVLEDLSKKLEMSERLLPGGYLYMTDILGLPRYVNTIGRLFATVFSPQHVDLVMTMETKGIPLAYSVASQLNVPVVIVRRNAKITEGSTVSINYVSGSQKRIQSMVLSRRSIQPNARVLIIDDFMKAGGTIRGMTSLLNEFEARLAGIGVFVEAKEVDERLVDEYVSLLRLAKTDEKSKKIQVEEGNYFQWYERVKACGIDTDGSGS